MIRSAGTGDLESLYALEIACFRDRRFSREHLLYLLRNPRASTFVFDEGAVVASLMIHDERGVLRVLSIGVHPEHRRRGIGRRLMAVAEEMAHRFGAREVRLEVSTKNEGAIAFYRALGYDVDGHLPRYYSWGDDAYAMRKPVAIAIRKT